MNNEKVLNIKGKAVAFVDWANVYGWRKSLKIKLKIAKLYRIIKLYDLIDSIYFYFGTDSNPKSTDFIKKANKIGYIVCTKPVKYIRTTNTDGITTKIRKCDFDIEIVMEVYRSLKLGYATFIFFSGDGDFEPIYRFLIEKKKQVVVISSNSHLGREIYRIKEGIYRLSIEKFFK